jgi:uncharacterized membrane protein YphA (DoxX/SURF4 family)
MSALSSLLRHPATALVARLLLGGFLIYASSHKIVDPPDFSLAIENYKFFPEQWINLLAIYVPWVELFTGVGLILGVGQRGGSILTMGLMLGFIGLLGYNLARGCPTICGCFETYSVTVDREMSDVQKFTEMRQEIALDVGLLVLAVYVFASSWRRPSWLSRRPVAAS